MSYTKNEIIMDTIKEWIIYFKDKYCQKFLKTEYKEKTKVKPLSLYLEDNEKIIIASAKTISASYFLVNNRISECRVLDSDFNNPEIEPILSSNGYLIIGCIINGSHFFERQNNMNLSSYYDYQYEVGKIFNDVFKGSYNSTKIRDKIIACCGRYILFKFYNDKTDMVFNDVKDKLKKLGYNRVKLLLKLLSNGAIPYNYVGDKLYCMKKDSKFFLSKKDVSLMKRPNIDKINEICKKKNLFGTLTVRQIGDQDGYSLKVIPNDYKKSTTKISNKNIVWFNSKTYGSKDNIPIWLAIWEGLKVPCSLESYANHVMINHDKIHNERMKKKTKEHIKAMEWKIDLTKSNEYVNARVNARNEILREQREERERQEKIRKDEEEKRKREKSFIERTLGGLEIL